MGLNQKAQDGVGVVCSQPMLIPSLNVDDA